MGRTGGGNPESSAFNGEDTAMNAALPEPSPKDESSRGMGPGDRRDSAYLRSENATPNGARRDGRDGTKAFDSNTSTPRERDEGSARREGGRRDGSSPVSYTHLTLPTTPYV